MNSIAKLQDFVNRALRSRKYARNTASSFQSPLKLLEPELNEEEKQSVDLIKKNLDQIFNVVYDRNSSLLSATSIQEYKRRIKNLISDYERYGTNPTAMANWERSTIARRLKADKPVHPGRKGEVAQPISAHPSPDNSVEVGEFKFVLPINWDLEKTRLAIVKGEFSAIYEELEKLSGKLKKQTEDVEKMEE
jgi:hypothetical protein